MWTLAPTETARRDHRAISRRAASSLLWRLLWVFFELPLIFDREFRGIGVGLNVSFTRMSFNPKSAGNGERLNLYRFPPASFIASLMELSMMPSAKRDSEFIANFHAQCAGLCKTQMMRIAGVASANKARLRRDKA